MSLGKYAAGVFVILVIGIISTLIGWVVAGISTPTLGALGGGIVFTVASVRYAVKTANDIFDLINNIDSWSGEDDAEEPETTEIGGENVTRREDFINQQLDRLDGWFTIFKDDSWEIHPKETTADDPRYLLYVLAAKVASQNNAKENTHVSIAELEREVDTRFPPEPFINKSRHFLVLHYDPDEVWVGHDIEKEDAKVEFDFDAIEEGVDWILSGSRDPPREYQPER